MKKVTQLHSVPTTGAQSTSAAMPRQFSKARDTVLELLGGLLSHFLDVIDDRLFDLADKAVESERTQLLDAMREVRIKRSGIETRFYQTIYDAFAQFSKKDTKEETKEIDFDNLTLVNDNELEVDVAIDNMARRVRNKCDKQLDAFNHRIKYLYEGRFDVNELNSPLEPRQVGRAFQKSIETVEVDIRTRLVLLKLFEREVLAEVGHVVSEANQLLIDDGVLPEMKQPPIAPRKEIKQQSGASTRNKGTLASLLGEEVDAGSESGSQMTELLEELLIGMRAMFANGAHALAAAHQTAALPTNMATIQNGVAYVGDQPVAAGTEVRSVSSDDLLNVLGRLQKVEKTLEDDLGKDSLAVKKDLSDLLDDEHGDNVLHAIEREDDDVINLVAMLFDFILDDQNLPSAIKALISRLQIPLLKVAITDKSFFVEDSHPARQLLNVLAKVGAKWSSKQGKEDVFYQLVESTVHQVLDDYDLDVSLFDELLDKVNDAIEQQSRISERMEARVREEEQGRAQAEEANRSVDIELDKRLAGRNLPEVAERILRGGWRQVLFLTWLREGADSEQWQKHLKVADAVVWSLLPHKEEGAIERLKALSPRLLVSLDQGLIATNYDPNERQNLLASLKREHHLLLSGMESERIKVEATIAPDVQPECSLPIDSPLIEQMKSLTSGQWIEIGSEDEAMRCKLAANIRQGQKMVFINPRGVKVAEFSAIELAEKFHQGEARLLEDSALFDRALVSVITNLRQQTKSL